MTRPTDEEIRGALHQLRFIMFDAGLSLSPEAENSYASSIFVLEWILGEPSEDGTTDMSHVRPGQVACHSFGAMLQEGMRCLERRGIKIPGVG